MDEETEIDINASKDLWQDTLAIADKYIPQFAAAFLISVAFQIRNIDKTALTNAIASGNANQVNDVLKWDKTFEKLMKLQTKIKACAYESSKNANKKMGYGADPKTSYSFRYIEQYGSKKIKNINDETYNAIQELLKTSFRGDLTTKETANAISKFIGLDSRRFNSLMKYENALVKEGYQPSVIKKMVQDQRNMMLRQRAEVIARTETMAASNYGTIASYKDMVDRGILDKNKYWLAWMITPDDRLCDKCRTMKNKNANIGSNFFNESARNPAYEHVYIEHPPLHPQCRCTTYLQSKADSSKKPQNTKPDNRNNPSNIKIIAQPGDEFIAQQTLNNLNMLPKKLRSMCNEFVILPKPDPQDEALSKLYGYAVRTDAAHDSIHKRILGYPGADGKTRPISLDLLAHELAHPLDESMGNISQKLAWSKYAAKDGKFVSNYAADYYKLNNNNYKEDFADSIKLYITDHDNFVKNFPNRAEYIERMIL